MKKYLFIVLCFLIRSQLSADEHPDLKLGDYLKAHSQVLQGQLVQGIRKGQQTYINSSDIEILGIYHHGEEMFDQNSFTLFNKTFFAIGDEIFLATLDETLNMDLYGEFKHEETDYFKAFEYHQTGFLALHVENEILIYILMKNSTNPELIQRISAPYFSDGIFFKNAASLYFVASTNPVGHIGFIKIYKWFGSHFDEIVNYHVSGAVTICSFPYQNSEIIIVGQSLPEKVKIPSSVYEFEKDEIKKKHHLSTVNPTHMNIFLQKGVTYILIYEESKNQKLYAWNGFEMILVNSFQWKHKVDKSIVVYSNTIPLIVQPQLDKVLVFKPHNENIKLYQTRNYVENYSIILEINKGQNENGNITFIGGLNENNILNIYAMSFKALPEIDREQEETLQKCFNNLEKQVYDRQEKLNQTNNRHVVVPFIDKRRRAISDFTINETHIESLLHNLNNRLNDFKPLVIKQGNFSNELIINGTTVIRKSITTKKIKAKKLKYKRLNGRNWTPERWLQYNQNQTVKGPVYINRIKTDILVANEDARKLFQNLLRNNGNQHVTGNIKIKQLSSSKIYAKTINGIKVNNIYKRGDSSTIKGVKSFKNVSSKKTNVDRVNGKKVEDIISILQNNSKISKKFASHVKIDNLEVESIDKINWEEFEKSVFKIGEDDLVEGNLSVPEMNVMRIQTKNINGIEVKNVMTTSTDQIINSTFKFNVIKAPNIECVTVNNIDISKAVRTDQNGTIIKGPVRIQEIHIINDLMHIGKHNVSSLKKGYAAFGTNHSDLVQRYLGKVVVDGNLYVNDFFPLENSTLFFKGNDYTIDILNEYWNKNGNQTIPVHFEATSGISTPHLNINSLNEIPMNNFSLNEKNSPIKSSIFFKNVTVNGNVFLTKNNASNSINLPKLAQEGVRNNGTTFNIKGKKIFNKELQVKVLEAPPVNKLYNASDLDNTTIKKLIVKGNLTGNIRAASINNINISDNILPLNQPQNLTDMMLENVTVENLQVRTINGHSIEKYLDKLENMLGKRQIERVNIIGNVTIQQMRDIETINGHNIEDFYKKVDNGTDSELDFIGDVKYTGKVKIGNLHARTINNINFPDLTKRLFYKKANQSVTGLFSFVNLKTVHLYAEKINEKNITNLIDITSNKLQEISTSKGIIFKNIIFEKSITAKEMIPCDINKAMKKIHSPETQEWSEVEIIGNANFLDENCDLVQILEKSVQTGQENIIIAPVFVEGHVLTQQVKAKNKLNGINLSELIEDVVLKDSKEEQIIMGRKTFKNIIDAHTVTVLENADIPIVNNIYVQGLYENIIRKEDANNIRILGNKTFFGGLQCNKIFTETIAGIKSEDIVTLNNSKQVPNALFDSIEILNDFNVKFINSYELDYILGNRLLTNTTEAQITNAVYYFNDLEIIGDLKTTAINNIQINDIVFDIGKQKIFAPKRFLHNVTVFGDCTVDYLNGISITEAYNIGVLRGDGITTINGSITHVKPVKFEGNITTQYINGYPIEEIKQVISKTSVKAEEETILNAREKVRTIIEKSMPAVEHIPSEFLYIEKSKDLQVEISNAIDASVVITKGYALIHIISEESHKKCNLPEDCTCLIQHTIEITPQHSVNFLLNQQQQRSYTYDDDTMTVHLTTNSISYNTQCRANQTDKISEGTIMAWANTTAGNTTGSFNFYPIFTTGYISGAQFFTLNGIVYAIIARYYDPIIDSHDLNCKVLRFNQDKGNVSEIQEIPTHWVKTLYLLHTAQGIILVIGNMAESPYTQIYRFNQNHQKFDLLRIVYYGCTKAMGVVLGTDSLIVLANEDAPLQVLKYQPNWDNYYYYQMFALDEHVLGMSVFYIGDFGISEAYLCIVTEDNYRIYTFEYIDGWKLELEGSIKGLRNLIPFELNGQLYLFAPSTDESSLLTVVKYGA